MNDMAVALLERLEGFRSVPYQDVAGNWTIGYGFIYQADGSRVTANTPSMTQEEAAALLQANVAATAAKVREMVCVPITPAQEASLVSFAYNEGTGALRGSTLLRLLNTGDIRGAADQFCCWVYAGQHRVEGLVNRRNLERAVFLGLQTP